MSRVQRRILAAGLLAGLAAALFPPWRCVGSPPEATTQDLAAGYGFILRPPAFHFPQRGPVSSDRLRIDAGLLLAELALVGGITGLALVGVGRPTARGRATHRHDVDRIPEPSRLRCPSATEVIGGSRPDRLSRRYNIRVLARGTRSHAHPGQPALADPRPEGRPGLGRVRPPVRPPPPRLRDAAAASRTRTPPTWPRTPSGTSSGPPREFVYDPARGSFRGLAVHHRPQRDPQVRRPRRTAGGPGTRTSGTCSKPTRTRPATGTTGTGSTGWPCSTGPRPGSGRSSARPTWEAFWRTAVGGEDVAAVAADLGLTAGGVYIARSRVTTRIRQEIRAVDGDDE